MRELPGADCRARAPPRTIAIGRNGRSVRRDLLRENGCIAEIAD
jgi:hypothetical protein